MVHSNDDYENKSGFKFTKISPAQNAKSEIPVNPRPGDLDVRPTQKPTTSSYPRDDAPRWSPSEMQADTGGYQRPGSMFTGGYSAPMTMQQRPFPPQEQYSAPMAVQTRSQGMSPADRVPTTLESDYYTAGYLEEFVGQRMRVEFLIGTNGPLVDRTGRLVKVGASYIVLEPENTDDLLFCDLYSIKFVTIFR